MNIRIRFIVSSCGLSCLALSSLLLAACLSVWAGLDSGEGMGQDGVEARGWARLKPIPLSFLPLLSTVSAPGVSNLTILHDTDQFL